MSITNLVLQGFSNGTVISSISKLVLFGYDTTQFVPPAIPVSDGLLGNQSTGNGISGNQSTGSGIASTQILTGSLTGRGRL
jgi:hypothetical protein